MRSSEHFPSMGGSGLCLAGPDERLSAEPGASPHPLQVLFTPATQAARQAACTIVEALATIPSRKQQVLDLLTRYHLRAGWAGWRDFIQGALPLSRGSPQARAAGGTPVLQPPCSLWKATESRKRRAAACSGHTSSGGPRAGS